MSSSPGKGTAFTVTLPANAMDKEPDLDFEPRGKALIIEDSCIQRLLLARILQRQSIETIEAVDGLTGLEALRAHRPDVVFLDLNMPKLDGRDVLKLLRADETLRQLPVCVVSATDTPENRGQCLALGANAYFTKPPRPSELTEFLNTTLNL